ncbi:MAG: nucleotidyltransferase family protein [Steroidobacteraceae bacterium]|nr:nucleotidyltransferase family protein [Steroidobacteraceae bacterium]
MTARERVTRAMILAAGRGERMRPLTLTCPKPLLEAGGRPLIVWHLERLARAGVTDVVVNLSWLGERIPAALGDGSGFGLRLHYVDEGPEPLETGGGIVNALAHFGEGPFAVVNGDVWTDAPVPLAPAPGRLAHLVLVPNPPQHPRGDFGLEAGECRYDGPRRHTFSGIASYRPELFRGQPPGKRPLKPLLDRAIHAGLATAELYRGRWTDVGTPERLAALDAELRGAAPRGADRAASA